MKYKERWITGYKDKYKVATDGNVFYMKNGKKKHLWKGVSNRGYYYVHLNKNGKQINKSVHRIVLETFKPQIGMFKLQVNHKDGNKFNNKIENLEWCTAKENTQHAIENGLWPKEKSGKKVVDVTTNKIYKSCADASRDTGLRYKSIWRVAKGERNHTGGHQFRFID